MRRLSVGGTAAPLVRMRSGSLGLHPRERLLDALGRQAHDEIHDAPLLAAEGAVVLARRPLLRQLVHASLEHLEPPQA